MANFVFECAAVKRLSELLRLDIAPDCFRHPNRPGYESGADVEMLFKSRRVGVQVTQYHVDEAVTGSGGSKLREEEVKQAKAALKAPGTVKAYGSQVSAQYLASLSHRVKEKVKSAKAKSDNPFDELWLLICAQVPSWGGTSSTTISSLGVRLSDLNIQIAPLLLDGPFSRAVLMIWFEGVVYEWTSGQEWEELVAAPTSTLEDNRRVADIVFNRHGARSNWLRDPKAEEEKAIADVLAEFRNKDP